MQTDRTRSGGGGRSGSGGGGGGGGSTSSKGGGGGDDIQWDSVGMFTVSEVREQCRGGRHA